MPLHHTSTPFFNFSDSFFFKIYSPPPLKKGGKGLKCVIYFNDSPLKMIKNALYLILKAIFVLKIFKFLSLIFGHLEKTA